MKLKADVCTLVFAEKDCLEHIAETILKDICQKTFDVRLLKEHRNVASPSRSNNLSKDLANMTYVATKNKALIR